MVTLVQGSANSSIYYIVRSVGRRTGESKSIKEVSIQYHRSIEMVVICFRCLFVDPFTLARPRVRLMQSYRLEKDPELGFGDPLLGQHEPQQVMEDCYLRM